MLTNIAWRNVWRSKIRSSVVIVSIALGLWAGTFIMAFSWGMSEQRVNEAIDNQISHLQIHHPSFKEEHKAKFTVPKGWQRVEEIGRDERVQAATGRAITDGMITTTSGGAGVQIRGVQPKKENAVTGLKAKVDSGQYFQGVSRNPAVIGRELADKFNLDVKSKFVLQFQDKSGAITSGAFRVAGIFNTSDAAFEERNVFVTSDDLNRLLGFKEAKIHEIAVLLKDKNALDAVQSELSSAYPDMLVESWKQIAPELQLIVDTFGQIMYIFIAIILLALAFGIINTMLMAVLERTRELGMLMAIGMNKTRVFMMITTETIFLSLIGAPVGLLLAWLTIYYTGYVGIDLSMVSEGLSAYGISTVIYPTLHTAYYIQVSLMVVAIAILSAIYPAIKALQLQPANAIRKI